MKPDASERESDPLESALHRLAIPILAFDSEEKLRPLNRAGVRLAEEEQLDEDAFTSQPQHPLCELIRAIAADGDGEPSVRTVVFPSGASYEVEASARSAKGKGRWIVLLLRKPESRANLEELFGRWDLTTREREVVEHLIKGEKSEVICDKLCFSHNTLKAHLRSIFSKSGSGTRAELLSKILR